MKIYKLILLAVLMGPFCFSLSQEALIPSAKSVLEIRPAGENGLRVTIMPLEDDGKLPWSPAINEERAADPVARMVSPYHEMDFSHGKFRIGIDTNPLKITVKNSEGELVQSVTMNNDGTISFKLDDHPVLGMGEGGPRMGRDWRNETIEFDRRGRLHNMVPRWQSNAYGSRNPVPLIIGTSGWALFVATPWVEIDLTGPESGRFIPWDVPAVTSDSIDGNITRMIQGRPPASAIKEGIFDLFIFDAGNPADFMKDLSVISGEAVMPPKWALGYMQSHRTLEDETQMIDIVKTFREKKIPVDAVIYLGTGFCPRGWNTEQPSFDFNPEVFKRDPAEVISDLHDLDVKVVLHIVPWRRDRLPTLQGTIPPAEGEATDNSHILDYWLQHTDLVSKGVDGWWPDEGDWFNLFERVKRHQLYYQGPVYTIPGTRPWSLHRNGYLGIAKWGGWVWSGDTESSWKTLEGQVAVGINHSLSLSPYWGSDIGGFYPGEDLTGEMYARWFQFAAFCPSFRSHGRTWWTRLPWGWGLDEMGPLENRTNPHASELNNPFIEEVCRDYAELRYRLMPYTYTLAWEARNSGLPLMRALWLHYPDDQVAAATGSEYLWGRDMLVAPVFKPGVTEWEVYLPEGRWYDWWTGESFDGGKTITRDIDLKIMPLFVRAGSVIPVDPVRQYTGQEVDGLTTIKIFPGSDGQFTLYEDDGTGEGYPGSKAVLTEFKWDDGKQRLTIRDAGNTAGIYGKNPRNFIIEIVNNEKSRKVTYKGEPLMVKF